MRYFTLNLKERFPFLGEDGRDPMLKVYLPLNMRELDQEDIRRPSVLLCPGGGYRIVSNREGEPVVMHLLAEGYNVFELKYSTYPNGFPIQLREVAAAMELISENAELWNTDPARVAIMGFSAGGHLAAHYTNSYDCPEVRAVFPDSKPVAASVLCYAVLSANEGYCHKASFERLSGHSLPLTREEHLRYSAEELVSERTPPTFLWHMEGDKTVPVISSLVYAQALAKHKVPFTLHIYPGGKHGASTCDEQSQPQEMLRPQVRYAKGWIRLLQDWLKETL